MLYLVVFLLAVIVVLLVAGVAARHLICNPILRAAHHLDTIIHQGMICSKCRAPLFGEPRGRERGDEVFVEVRSKGATRRFAVGAQSRDTYNQPRSTDEVETLIKKAS